jgi:hypothetical protein
VKRVSNCLPTPNQFYETVIRICEERGDVWGECCVFSRIIGGFNLENSDVLFHQQCEIHFRLKRNIPLKNTQSHPVAIEWSFSVSNECGVRHSFETLFVGCEMSVRNRKCIFAKEK